MGRDHDIKSGLLACRYMLLQFGSFLNSIMIEHYVKNKDRIDTKFHCLACLLLLRTPVQLICGHRQSKSCIESAHRQRRKNSMIVSHKYFHISKTDGKMQRVQKRVRKRRSQDKNVVYSQYSPLFVRLFQIETVTMTCERYSSNVICAIGPDH